MICPVGLAHEMSVLDRRPEVRVRGGGRHGTDTGGSRGAGDEGTRSDFASHGQEDYGQLGRQFCLWEHGDPWWDVLRLTQYAMVDQAHLPYLALWWRLRGGLANVSAE